MKTLKYIALGIIILINITTYAQVAVNVKIGSPPVWGPPVTVEEYYYLPDLESYYDLRTGQFIYINNGSWIRSKTLPLRYRSYDLKRGTIIILKDYHGNSPYVNYKVHKVKYVKQRNNSNENNKHVSKSKNKGNKHKDNGNKHKGKKD